MSETKSHHASDGLCDGLNQKSVSDRDTLLLLSYCCSNLLADLTSVDRSVMQQQPQQQQGRALTLISVSDNRQPPRSSGKTMRATEITSNNKSNIPARRRYEKIDQARKRDPCTPP